MGHSHLPRQEWFAIGKTPGPQLLGELGCKGGCSVEASEGYTRQVFLPCFEQAMAGGGQLRLGRWGLCGGGKNAKVIIVTSLSPLLLHLIWYLHALTSKTSDGYIVFIMFIRIHNLILVRYLDDLPTNVMDYLMG